MNGKQEAWRDVRRRNRVAIAVWSCTLLTLVAAVSGAQESGTSDWERPNNSCEPACRSGYECRRGECTPVCSPACPSALSCSADGDCVSAERARPAKSVRAARAPMPLNTCEPSCRSGFICQQSRCVSLCNPVCPADESCTADGECISAHVAPPPDVDSESGAALVDARDPSAHALVNVHADVAGLLQFGLTPTIEVGETLSGYLRLRFINTGLASYFLLGRDANDELRFGAGAALGFHWFSAKDGNMRGFYAGAALEYAFVETSDDSVDFARYRTQGLIPQIDFGHRWALGSFLIGVSAKLGLAIPLSNRARGIGPTPCARPDSCREDLSVSFIPGLGVDLGWFLPR